MRLGPVHAPHMRMSQTCHACLTPGHFHAIVLHASWIDVTRNLRGAAAPACCAILVPTASRGHIGQLVRRKAYRPRPGLELREAHLALPWPLGRWACLLGCWEGAQVI